MPNIVDDTPILSPKGTFPATVVEVIDNFKIVINKGEVDGIRKGERILLYRLSDDEIIDPQTGESLGYLEIVKGTGKIIHLQEKMSIIESDQTKLIKTTYRRNRYPFIPKPNGLPEDTQETEESVLVPFDEPQVGDRVKPI